MGLIELLKKGAVIKYKNDPALSSIISKKWTIKADATIRNMKYSAAIVLGTGRENEIVKEYNFNYSIFFKYQVVVLSLSLELLVGVRVDEWFTYYKKLSKWICLQN